MFLIGSDGGSELYGVNASGTYLNFPGAMEEENITYLGDELTDNVRYGNM